MIAATVASAGYDGVIDLWNLATRAITATTRVPAVAPRHPGVPGSPMVVAFSPGNRALSIGDAGSGAYRWDLASGRRTRQVAWTGCSYAAGTVAFSADTRYVATTASGCSDGNADRVRAWNADSGALATTITDPAGYPATSVAVGPDGGKVAFGDEEDGGPDTDVTFPASAYLWKVG